MVFMLVLVWRMMHPTLLQKTCMSNGYVAGITKEAIVSKVAPADNVVAKNYGIATLQVIG